MSSWKENQLLASSLKCFICKIPRKISSAKYQEMYHLQNSKKKTPLKLSHCLGLKYSYLSDWWWDEGSEWEPLLGNESISESSQTIHQDGVEANYQIHFIVRIHSSFWRMRDWQIIEKADWRPLWFIRMKQPAGWQFNSGPPPPPPRLQSGCWSEDRWQMSSPIEQRDRRDTFSDRRPI